MYAIGKANRGATAPARLSISLPCCGGRRATRRSPCSKRTTRRRTRMSAGRWPTRSRASNSSRARPRVRVAPDGGGDGAGLRLPAGSGSSCPPAGECVVPDARVHDPTWCAANRDPPVYGCRRRRVQCATSRPGRKTCSPGQRGDDPTTGTRLRVPVLAVRTVQARVQAGRRRGLRFPWAWAAAPCASRRTRPWGLRPVLLEVFDGEPRPDALHAQLIYPRGQDRRVCATATGASGGQPRAPCA